MGREMDVKPVTFDDLLEIRKGGEDLTMGGGESRIEGIQTAEEWNRKADALLEILHQTLGQPPDNSAPLLPEVLEEVDCGDYFRRTVAYDVGPGERIRAYVLVPRA